MEKQTKKSKFWWIAAPAVIASLIAILEGPEMVYYFRKQSLLYEEKKLTSDYEKAFFIYGTRQHSRYAEAIELCKSAVKDNNPADDVAAYDLRAGLACDVRMRELVKKKKSPLERQIGGLDALLEVYEEAAKAYPENSHFKEKIKLYQERLDSEKQNKTKNATNAYK